MQFYRSRGICYKVMNYVLVVVACSSYPTMLLPVPSASNAILCPSRLSYICHLCYFTLFSSVLPVNMAPHLMALDVVTPCSMLSPTRALVLCYLALEIGQIYIGCSVASSLKMSSYMPNMIAALGTVLRRCGVKPPYMETIPSSFQTSLKH